MATNNRPCFIFASQKCSTVSASGFVTSAPVHALPRTRPLYISAEAHHHHDLVLATIRPAQHAPVPPHVTLLSFDTTQYQQLPDGRHIKWSIAFVPTYMGKQFTYWSVQCRIWSHVIVAAHGTVSIVQPKACDAVHILNQPTNQTNKQQQKQQRQQQQRSAT